MAKAASWPNPTALKAQIGPASLAGQYRVVSNIAGNKHRLVVGVNYRNPQPGPAGKGCRQPRPGPGVRPPSEAAAQRDGTLRCTQKLLRRLKDTTPAPAIAPTTRLGDWYLNILFVRPQHLLLCTSERTLLPVLLPARDLGTLAPRLCQGLSDVLTALEIPAPMVAAELREMESCVFGPTANRQVLGSMNDFAHMMAWRRHAGQECDLLQMALDLAESPCSPLRHNSPDRATRQVFWGDQPQAPGVGC